jgi:2-polyprenyl-3-methyl-5-hydroxy-6-metoxy-1,4-benzoquinol methylase
MGAHRVPAADLLEVTASLAPHDRDEMAVPSYCHKNPLIRRLFWRRLDLALELAELRPGSAVLELGIGSGILLPSFRARGASRVVGVDLELGPSREMARRLGIALEQVHAPELQRWAEQNQGAFDAIFALDVLEHVDTSELEPLSLSFVSLLKKGGRLIVSGPTESLAYKLGRMVAGFKNHYHHRNIFDIERVLHKSWAPTAARRLPRFPLPQAFSITRYAPR